MTKANNEGACGTRLQHERRLISISIPVDSLGGG